MDTIGPILLLAFNCLGIPALFFFLGVAWSRGWLRSPVHIERDVPYEEEF